MNSVDTGEDDDTQQLTLKEFFDIVPRMCDCKIPESCRFGEPFEYTWQAWLQTQFVPKFRRVLKGKV